MSATRSGVTKQIKIIKLATRQDSPVPVGENPTTTTRGDAEKLERPDAATTVARWVGEMRKRKEKEARTAFDKLFEKRRSGRSRT